MSQITLLNEKITNSLKQGKEYAFEESRPILDTVEYSSDEEGSEIEMDPPVIHCLRFGDTVASICKRYEIEVLSIN